MSQGDADKIPCNGVMEDYLGKEGSREGFRAETERCCVGQTQSKEDRRRVGEGAKREESTY